MVMSARFSASTGAICGRITSRSRCHAPETLEVGRLVQLARDALQARELQDHAERAAAPRVGGDHRARAP